MASDPFALGNRRKLWNLGRLLEIPRVIELLYTVHVHAAPSTFQRQRAQALKDMVADTLARASGPRRSGRSKSDSEVFRVAFAFASSLTPAFNVELLAARIKLLPRQVLPEQIPELVCSVRVGCLVKLMDYLVDCILDRRSPDAGLGLELLRDVNSAATLNEDLLAGSLLALLESELAALDCFQSSDSATRQLMRERSDAPSAVAGASRPERRAAKVSKWLEAAPWAASAIWLVSSMAAARHMQDVFVAVAAFPLVWDTVARIFADDAMSRLPERSCPALRLDLVTDYESVAVVFPVLLHPKFDPASFVSSILHNFTDQASARTHLVILTDFSDAEQMEEREQESAMLDKLLTELEARCETKLSWAVLHRDRVWSDTQQCYIGAERKRGKLVELGRFIRAGESGFRRMCGRGVELDKIRWMLVLDEDSVLTPGSLMKLVAAAMHPLNAPGPDHEGFGIIAPSSGATVQSVDKWRCANLFATAPSRNVLYDVFGERQFSGKGIIHNREFCEHAAKAMPSERILSHDVVEGFLLGTAHCREAVVAESMPPSYLLTCERMHRWIRGDLQNLMFRPRGGSRTSRIERHYMSVLGFRRAAQISLPVVAVACASEITSGRPILGFLLLAFLLFAPSAAGNARRLVQFGLFGLAATRDWAQEFVIAIGADLLRLLMSLHHSAIALHATLTVVARSYSGRNLLEWRTAAVQSKERVRTLSERLLASSGIASFFALCMHLLFKGNVNLVDALLLVWAVFPLLSRRVFGERSGARG